MSSVYYFSFFSIRRIKKMALFPSLCCVLCDESCWWQEHCQSRAVVTVITSHPGSVRGVEEVGVEGVEGVKGSKGSKEIKGVGAKGVVFAPPCSMLSVAHVMTSCEGDTVHFA